MTVIAAGLFAMGLLAQAGTIPSAPSNEAAAAEPPVELAEPAGLAAEVSIVAGNLASARKRALDEALYLAVDGAFVVLVEEMGLDARALPEALLGLRTSFRAGARRFVRSYRVLSEQERAGRFRIVVDPVIERNALGREIARARRAGASAQAPVSLWVGGSNAAAATLSEALTRAGLAVAGTVTGVEDVAALRAREPGAEGASVVLVRDERLSTGFVRGADLRVVECGVQVLVHGPSTERDRSAFLVTEHGFAETSEAAQLACGERAMVTAARRVGAILAARGKAETGAFVQLHLTFEQPFALERLLVHLARLDANARCEPRRIAVGAAFVRIATLLSADELGRALTQDAGHELVLDGMRAQGSDLYLRVALSEAAPAAVP